MAGGRPEREGVERSWITSCRSSAGSRLRKYRLEERVFGVAETGNVVAKYDG
jgi:hypothetical protein